MNTAGLNLAHDKKIQINIQGKIPSVLKVTRPGKKKVRGATKRRKQVQKVRMAPGVVIQQGGNGRTFVSRGEDVIVRSRGGIICVH
jgi:hypothetical protein